MKTIRTAVTGASRLHSLDVFRGITVFFMLLVNNPGSEAESYSQLQHAKWHGCTLTDLVFPFFLFIVGVSAVLSITKKMNAGVSTREIWRDVLKRSVLLVLIGLVLYLFPFYILGRYKTLRIPGVLQRIGLVYLAVGASILFLKKSQRFLLLAGLLLFYYIVMVWLPLPHGETSIPNLLNDPHATWSAWIDRALFWGHLWKFSIHWDPEGLLSSLPSMGTGLLGVMAGEWIAQTNVPIKKRITGLLAAGLIAVGLGLIWSRFMPLNKALWTSSYVLVSGGWAAVFLGACMWVCDVVEIKKPLQIFIWFGVNPILAFVGSAMMARTSILLIQLSRPDGTTISLQEHLYSAYYQSWISTPQLASLAYALSFISVWAVILFCLYRQRIFLKV